MTSSRKAYAYMRVSSPGRVDGDGFKRQSIAIEGYAKANGINVIEQYREEGVSGAKDLENRPALTSLMQALHSNGVRTVLIEKLDRLARDLMIQETIIGDMRKHGFELISVLEPDLCQDDPTRKLMRQIFGAIAEYEKTMLVIKLRAARERVKAEYGRCEGKKPYGHYPDEGPILKRMLELRAEGKSFERIARDLTHEGLYNRVGLPWAGTSIHRILTRMARGSRS